MSLQQSVSVENVVASTDVGRELDLESVALDLDGVDYDPEAFPGIVYQTDEPDAVALVFRSGKVVCTGAASVDAARDCVEILFTEFETLEIPTPEEPSITVQNIVSSGDLGEALNLNAIAIGLGLQAVEYEPEQFPGLVYRLDDPDVAMLLFGSGKVVVTGGTDPSDAPMALETIGSELESLGLLG
ncbi:TATA-box-binding protein [Halorientalis regularis]|jgi:transcription initiation factor TFIID TATA-box-binding protein|uniref:TATA-box-binding protein n=1 Tax=Halorientalis regularis TaxID=660518 RepID=A0A1G7MUE7_9EURY|nr:TATA-box-binding protein [Halorientalis regularis]SDF65362.1 TATA binding protein of transcription factor TFIID [Halorientalis regularis]